MSIPNSTIEACSAACSNSTARLQAALGERFARGIVLYTGDRAVPFGERLAAWPLADLFAGRDA